MRKSKKVLGAILCSSILCSSLMCANAWYVSAAETVDGVKSTEISSTAENEYFTTKDGSLVAKKQGYYSIVQSFKDESGKIEFLGISVDTVDGESSVSYSEITSNFADAVSFSKYSVGDSLAIPEGIYDASSGISYYLVYSSDGSSATKVFEVQPEVVPCPEPVTYKSPVVSNVSWDNTEVNSIMSATITSDKDDTLNAVEIRKLTDNYYISEETVQLSGTSAQFSYTFTENGKYELWVYASNADTTIYPVTVEGISTGINFGEDEFTDLINPTITTVIGDETGLPVGSSFKIMVTTDEICDISIGNQIFEHTTSAVAYVTSNDVYTITARDSWGNISKDYVTVKAFGSGQLPSGGIDSNLVNLSNDNPLSDGNRDSFWSNASISSSDGSRSVLPQTGSPAWLALVGGSAVVLTSAGVIVCKKTGVLRKRGAKK